MVCIGGINQPALASLLRGFGLQMTLVAPEQTIPGSYWGDPEAGLRNTTLFVRADTPLHSALHESAHFICMTDERRAALDRDAGGEVAEECAVCYLQLLLADELPHIGMRALAADMDAWGYSFRLGSTRRWFEEDAEDARQWLVQHGIIGSRGQIAHCVRR